jgi:hypothetical protein
MTEYDQTALGGALTGGQEIDQQIIQPPGGLLTAAIAGAISLFVNSPTFQALCSANGVSAADSVFIQVASLNGNVSYEPPFIIVIVPPGAITTNIMTGPYNKGSFKVMLVADIPATYRDSWNNIIYWFGGIVEGIVADVWNQVGTGTMGQLLVRDFNLEGEIQRADFSSNEDYVQCYFNLAWGAEH